ncbi:Lar family restriction alleviation protein [Halomonas elongata]|uniref:Lar family restriction alleviation protein n=1 Tax=Halomonas elongata TaxID=2746 RepID=UPI00186BADBA|nr:Lar family restriction alleviation protein [Halomonas elongata]MBW5802222.1 Lar family restriction alleviation protein [Halomonas elongata]
MSELKPCPFCGGTDLGYSTDVVMPDNWHDASVVCSGCDMEGPRGGSWQDSEADAKVEAAKAWNRRALPEGVALVPREITAESGYKARMIGDFVETIEDCCPECGGSGWDDGEDCEVCEGRGGWYRMVSVEWTTIKAIHRRVIEIAEEVPS